MDVNRYRDLCARPDVLRRGELEETVSALRRLRSPDVPLVAEILEQRPIERPLIHSAGSEADFFFVTVDTDVIESIVDQLFEAKAAAVPSGGEATPEATRLTELADLWTDCREYLENGGAA